MPTDGATRVYQPAHGFRRGQALSRGNAGWEVEPGAWDVVVVSVIDRDRFEVLAAGIIQDLKNLTPGAIVYNTDGTTPLYKATSPTTAVLLPAGSAEADAAEAAASSTTTTTNVTNITQEGDDVTNITETNADAVRRSWLGL